MKFTIKSLFNRSPDIEILTPHVDPPKTSVSGTNLCKVKIGCAYEPKWFEKRDNSGSFSSKNPVLSREAMGLQSCLLRKDFPFDNVVKNKRDCWLMAGAVFCFVFYIVAFYYYTSIFN